MKLSNLLSATATLALIAGSASALEFTGAQIDVDYVFATEDLDYSTTMLTGRGGVSIYNGFGLQLDLNSHSYSDSPEDNYFEYGVHLTYDLSPNTKLGAFYVMEDWDGDDYSYTGVEIKHDFNAFSVEAFVLQAKELDGGSWEPIIFGGELDYSITDQISLFAGAATYEDEGTYSFIYGGASYAITNALSAEIKLGQLRFDTESFTNVSVGASYRFGGGSDALFDARGYASLFPGD